MNKNTKYGLFGCAIALAAGLFAFYGNRSTPMVVVDLKSVEAVPVVVVDQVSDSKIGIAQIALEGSIDDSAAMVEKFTQLREDSSVHCVVLRINSPGGNVAASEILHHELLRLEQVKPVVVMVENDCCSGAYWTASAASYIIAPRAACVGSIGTLELIKKKDQKGPHDPSVEFLHAGDYKAFRSPNAPALTDEQREIVQSELDCIYEMFCNDVANARGLDISKHDEWANGREFVAELAPEGMIDALGYPSDALAKAEEFARERMGAEGTVDLLPMWRPQILKA